MTRSWLVFGLVCTGLLAGQERSAAASERTLEEELALAAPDNAAALLEQASAGSEAPRAALLPPTIPGSLTDGTDLCNSLDLDGAPLFHPSGLISIGVRCHGELNTDWPEDPRGSPFRLGLRFEPRDARSTEPGCPCEGWGIGAGTFAGVPVCTGESGSANRDDGVVGMTLLSFTFNDTEATSKVQIGTTFEVTHAYTPSLLSPNLYEVTVTIKNITLFPTNVLYRRSIDWDIDPTAFSEFITIDAGEVGTGIYRTCNNGFIASDPCSPLFACGGTTGFSFGPSEGGAPMVDSGPADRGALFDFDLGGLAPGAELTFKTYYGATGLEPGQDPASVDPETDAEAALAAVRAEAYSFGQPNCSPLAMFGPCPGLSGRLQGEPNTFIFAFGDLGAPPIFGCGNGIEDLGEECDDGNVIDGDGCSSDCELEVPEPPGVDCLADPPVVFPNTPSLCTGEVPCSAIAACEDSGPVDPPSCVPGSPYPVGVTDVIVTCSDGDFEVQDNCEVTVVDVEPPVCTAPEAFVLECEGPGGILATDERVSAWLASAMPGDNCGVASFTNDAPVPPLSFPSSCASDEDITVTWTVIDTAGLSGTCSSTFKLVDTSAPEIGGVPPEDVTVECDAVPDMPVFTATDICGEAELTPGEEIIPGECPAEFMLERTWLAEDECGLTTLRDQTVSVVDTTPPDVEFSDDIAYCLWPPLHKYACFGREDFSPGIEDGCSDFDWVFTGCASDQPDEAPDPEWPGFNGDGNTRNDCVVLPGGLGICVRAERCGAGPTAKSGRHYAVTIRATDDCDNPGDSTQIGTIWVPHDMRGKSKPKCQPGTYAEPPAEPPALTATPSAGGQRDRDR